MVDPYEVLNLPRHASEEDVRRRYLELVRAFPPERAPERFAEIRAAYDAVRDPVRRLETLILEPGSCDSLGKLAAEVRARLRERLAGAPWTSCSDWPNRHERIPR